jgi:hypothetical protein
MNERLRGHAEDCTIYSSLTNGNPEDGIVFTTKIKTRRRGGIGYNNFNFRKV